MEYQDHDLVTIFFGNPTLYVDNFSVRIGTL